MNIQLAFAFGMLAMVAIIMLVVIVVGMAKVIRHDKQFKNVHEETGFIHRHITEVERNLQQEITEVKKHFDLCTEGLSRELHSYTDSRADKLEQKLSGTIGTKQILKD